VVLNPVRARMVAQAEDWPWSSYRAMIGTEPAPPWLAVEPLLREFGRTRSKARTRYIDFVRAGVGLPSVWDNLTGQIYLGVDAFVKRMATMDEEKFEEMEVPRAQRRPLARPLSHYVSSHTDRKQGMALACASGDYTLAEVAQAFGVHFSTASRAVTGKAKAGLH